MCAEEVCRSACGPGDGADMELLRRALLAAALMVVLEPTAGRRRGSQRNRAQAGPEREVPRADWPRPEQMSADEPPANASSLVRSKRVKRQLVIPNGLTVGIIPRFDYTVFTNSNGEREYKQVTNHLPPCYQASTY